VVLNTRQVVLNKATIGAGDIVGGAALVAEGVRIVAVELVFDAGALHSHPQFVDLGRGVYQSSVLAKCLGTARESWRDPRSPAVGCLRSSADWIRACRSQSPMAKGIPKLRWISQSGPKAIDLVKETLIRGQI